MNDIELALIHYDGNNDMPYCDLVYQALKEQAQRNKGCGYCTGDVDTRPNIIGDGCNGVYIGGSRLTADDIYDMDSKKINYCPICGRKLGDDDE